jgi:hypothetical protein
MPKNNMNVIKFYNKDYFVFKIIFLNFMIFGLINVFAQSENFDRFKYLKERCESSEIIFEGYAIKRNPSFMTKQREIFTLIDYKVTKLYKGNIPKDSIIQIEIDGGSVYDSITGLVNESDAIGCGFGVPVYSQKLIYFTKAKNERGNRNIWLMVDIADPEHLKFSDIIPWDTMPYSKVSELYADLSKILGKNISVDKPEKKSPDLKREIKNNFCDIPYKEKYKTFQYSPNSMYV